MVNTKLRYLASSLCSLLLLIPSGSAIGTSRGDGPCPVPDLVSDFVSTKNFHSTVDPVRNLMAFEAEKRILFQTQTGEGGLIEYESGTVSTSTGAFAVFPGPTTLFPLASLRPVLLPKWFAGAEEIVKTPTSFTGAVAQSGLFGVHYQLYWVTDPSKAPVPSCSTPAMAGLKPSRGSRFPWAYFHSIRRSTGGKAQVRLFKLNLKNCAWVQESSFEEIGVVSDTDTVLRFPKQDAVLLTSSNGVLWRERGVRNYFDVSPKDLVVLDSELPVVLVRNQSNELQLFFPQRPGISTLLSDAVDFHPGLVGYASKASHLFIAGSAQGSDHTGVYELKLKLPL